MQPFSFATAGEIRFGRGVVAEAAPYAAARASRVLLLRSASVAAADDLETALDRSGAVMTRVTRGEPDLPAIMDSLAAARPFAPDLIVAIGGGAVIDHGKALAALLPAPSDPLSYLEIVGEGRALDAAPLPIVAIPTTAGTGTEVTRNAVIQVPEARRKVSLRDPRLYPALALVDPDLCASCPRGVTLASGLDAVTQVIEPYVSSRANPMTDALCRDAIPRGLAALHRLVEHDDHAAWPDMALVSLLGGIALANAGLGAVHGFAGVIGGMTGAAHGAICGTLLPPVLAENLRASPQGSEARDRLTWVQDQIALRFGDLDGFTDWTRAHGLPRLEAMGVTPEMHESVAAQAQGASSSRSNPVPLETAALIRALASA